MNSPLISLLALLVAGYICPKPKPLIGNALQIPTQTPWLTYAKWAETYQSDILHVEALGQHIIILNSREVVAEVMDQRAAIYSGRPSVPMYDLMDWTDSTPLLPHGDQWRHHRRILHQSFKKDAIVQYESIGMKKIQRMLRSLLETPDDLQAHIRTVAAAIIMAIVYGHNVLSMDDKYVSIAEKAVKAGSEALLPGASLVNTIPVLRHIPPWFPGVKFHKLAAEVKELRYQMVNSGFEFVRKNMQDGTGEPSLLQDLLEAHDANGGSVEDEDVLKSVSSIAYAGGADTTVSSLTTFFCAMVISPDVQRKAQHEIDTVVGNDRLPEPGDRPSLPYVEAIYREVMRWRPVTPLGLPHTSTEDDVYKGYFIPKGSVVFANVWAMTHDEHIYKNPDKFEPERYFDSQGNLNDDDAILTFGFGRRACVGRHLASSTVWLMIASALATVNITKAKDSQGSDIEIDGGYTDGVVIHPRPFPCSVTPRSPKILELISCEE